MTDTKLDVRVYPIDDPKGNTKAFASVAVNDLVAIRGIRVVEDNKGLFVTMPQSFDKKAEKYHDIAFPLDGGLRKEITKAILGEHDKQINLDTEQRGYPPPDKDAAPIAIDIDNVKLDIRVYPIDDPQGNVQAFASISIDDMIAIRGVRLIEGEEDLFVSMPQTQDKYMKYHDVAFPLTKELRDEITKGVIEKFENADRVHDRKQSLGDKLAAGADKAANHTAPEKSAAKAKHAGVLE